jgi:hypothetical protein
MFHLIANALLEWQMKEFDDFSSDLFITHPHATFEK